MSYQCVICYGPTPLKGGGLCFHDAMALGGKGTSELWCHQCQGPSSEAKVYTVTIPPTPAPPK